MSKIKVLIRQKLFIILGSCDPSIYHDTSYARLSGESIFENSNIVSELWEKQNSKEQQLGAWIGNQEKTIS